MINKQQKIQKLITLPSFFFFHPFKKKILQRIPSISEDLQVETCYGLFHKLVTLTKLPQTQWHNCLRSLK